MQHEEYKQMYDQELKHWWFRGKRAIIMHLLKKHITSGARALDFGCGTGALLAALREYVHAEGVDVSPEAIAFCKKRGIESVERIPEEGWNLSENAYDIIVASDVLEHIEDDISAFRKLYRALRPGGIFLITVPAHKWLWSAHDEALHHKRRYSRRMLKDHGKQAGFMWDSVSYYNMFLFPIALPMRLASNSIKRKAMADTASLPPRIINEVLFNIFQSEKYFLSHVSFPIGLSLIAHVTKYESR